MRDSKINLPKTLFPKRKGMTATIIAVSILSAAMLTACSSGGSTSGVGLNVSGTWRGVMRSNVTRQQFPLTIQLTQTGLAVETGVQNSTLSGVATVGSNAGSCVTGGVVTGTTSGPNITITFGEHTYSGRINGDGAFEGLWSTKDATPTTEPPVVEPPVVVPPVVDPPTGGGSGSGGDPQGRALAACPAFNSGNFSVR